LSITRILCQPGNFAPALLSAGLYPLSGSRLSYEYISQIYSDILIAQPLASLKLKLKCPFIRVVNNPIV
jgi:hypothetical protein